VIKALKEGAGKFALQMMKEEEGYESQNNVLINIIVHNIIIGNN